MNSDIENKEAGDINLLKSLTDHIPVALYQFVKYPHDAGSRFIYASRAVTSIFEVSPEELMADAYAFRSRIHPDDLERVDKSIDDSIEKSAGLWDSQFRVVLPEKGMRWIRGVSRHEKLDDGGVLSNGYFEDVTEQKNASDWIKYINTALSSITESIIISAPGGKIIYANQRVKELHGYEPEELIGKPVDMMNVKPMSEEDLSELLRTISEGRAYVGQEYSRRKDGSTFLCEFTVTPVKGDEQVSSIGVQRDITERTQILKALRESNERFEQLTQQSRSIVWEIAPDGLFVYLSGAMETVMGYSPEELVSKVNVFDFVLPSERRRLKAFFRSIYKEGRPFSDYKFPFIHKSGNTIHLSLSGMLFSNEDSGTINLRGLAIDITEKEKMEQRIVEENERYITTLLSMGEGVVSTDFDGIITVMNPIAERITGWSQRKAVGKPLSQVLKILQEDDKTIIENPVAAVVENSQPYKPSYPTVLVSASGEEIPVDFVAAPIKNYHGSISGVVIVVQDFTEYRKRQKQIEFLSFNDHLTGLYNRRYFESAVKNADTEDNLPIALMVMDANELKLTNDAFGHETGDKLLCAISDILRGACGPDDIAARIGGDEFALLMPRTDEAKVEEIRKRIDEAASATTVGSLRVSLSAGYAIKKSMDESLDYTFKTADKLMYKEKFSQSKIMQDHTIDSVLKNINTKYEQEQLHTERISQYCYLIADALGMSEKEKQEIRLAGLMHDIGKVLVPTDLLNVPRKLTEEEFSTIKQHSEAGYQILKSVDQYMTIAMYVLHHHEHWDGSGYPFGLKGEAIPLQSRIIAVADAFEAMTSDRVYRKTKTVEEAVAEIKRCSGAQFDPRIVKAFADMLTK